jgi:hypothetical protein
VLEVVVGDAQLGRAVAAQVGVDGVGRAHQVLEHLAPARMAQVERDGALAGAEGLEEQRVLALLVRRHVASDVAARAGVLDLDDVGAQAGQVQGAPRARAVLLHGDDADVVERRPHAATRVR